MNNYCGQLLLFIIIFTFSGCLPQDQKKEVRSTTSINNNLLSSEKDLQHLKVGYCGPSMVAPYYVALETVIKETVKHYGMEYFTADGQEDISKQVAAIEDLLSKGIDVLILNPLDPKAVVPVVNRAHNEGVKVFIVDSMVDPSAHYISSIVANNMMNGELLGLWLADQKVKDPKIAIISGNQGNPVGREKRLGFIRGLVDGQLHNNAKTNFTIAAHGWGKWNNNGGVKAMEDILVAHPYINVLFAENDAMALGALKAIQEMGKQKDILVIGVDGQKEAYEKMMEGVFAATAENSPKKLGELVVQTMVRYFNGDKDIDKTIYTPSILISQNNIKDFYDPKALF
ncbi:substrate-binding domain-containing protein [Sphingobacterium rhinopitheci]|uniref:substrate-binding domain-containing protein n=1 Tax=Sphingobacterium rhinopitheci TaxID=2781960 RepID=UPI001F51EFED|nr:substrate-binding domain-containing protein [Sphingobacterium rhinopitheci]MCI0922320.1 substrate-binding domain-containing protein [Sphingobacterium rhinopitheci]